VRVSPERFEELAFDLAEEILAELPPELRADAEEIILDVEYRPTREQMESVGLEPDHTLLGLFTGVPLVERHADTVRLSPDRITLFQQPIQGACRTEIELKARLRRTLIHELAHFFGRTDEELLAMGRY